MVKSKLFIILGIVLILLITPVYSIESTSYNATKVHIGLTGNNASSSSFTLKFTTYYQQQSNVGSSATYSVVVGFQDVNNTELIVIDVCGDGVVGATEECDDANSNNNDACKNDCTDNVCGDGYLYTGNEECDDGNLIDNDGCSLSCNIERNPAQGGGSSSETTLTLDVDETEVEIDIEQGQTITSSLEINNPLPQDIYFDMGVITNTCENLSIGFVDQDQTQIEGLLLEASTTNNSNVIIPLIISTTENTAIGECEFIVEIDSPNTKNKQIKFLVDVNKPMPEFITGFFTKDIIKIDDDHQFQVRHLMLILAIIGLVILLLKSEIFKKVKTKMYYKRVNKNEE